MENGEEGAPVGGVESRWNCGGGDVAGAAVEDKAGCDKGFGEGCGV